MIPEPYTFVLLALASYRSWRLLVEDQILDLPRRKLLRLGNWTREGDPVPADYRQRLGDFLSCVACFGFWLSLAWYGAWLAWEEPTKIVAVPFALSAIVVFLRSRLDPPEAD